MRCSHAHKLLEQKETQGVDLRNERALADHLSICPECAQLDVQLELTWKALGHHPTVEPSPDFLPKLREKLKAERAAPGRRQIRRLDLRWQWVALAACALLAAVLLSRSGNLRHVSMTHDQGTKAVTDRDRLDEQFLEDLEQTLQQSNAGYLSTYDSWPGPLKEATVAEPAKPAPADRVKRKERS